MAKTWPSKAKAITKALHYRPQKNWKRQTNEDHMTDRAKGCAKGAPAHDRYQSWLQIDILRLFSSAKY